MMRPIGDLPIIQLRQRNNLPKKLVVGYVFDSPTSGIAKKVEFHRDHVSRYLDVESFNLDFDITTISESSLTYQEFFKKYKGCWMAVDDSRGEPQEIVLQIEKAKLEHFTGNLTFRESPQDLTIVYLYKVENGKIVSESQYSYPHGM